MYFFYSRINVFNIYEQIYTSGPQGNCCIAHFLEIVTVKEFRKSANI